MLVPKIISPPQSVFIPNRDVHDVAREIFTTFLNLEQKMVIKLDMKKLYNRFAWSFIKKCLNNLGFNNTSTN